MHASIVEGEITYAILCYFNVILTNLYRIGVSQFNQIN